MSNITRVLSLIACCFAMSIASPASAYTYSQRDAAIQAEQDAIDALDASYAWDQEAFDTWQTENWNCWVYNSNDPPSYFECLDNAEYAYYDELGENEVARADLITARWDAYDWLQEVLSDCCTPG